MGALKKGGAILMRKKTGGQVRLEKIKRGEDGCVNKREEGY